MLIVQSFTHHLTKRLHQILFKLTLCILLCLLGYFVIVLEVACGEHERNLDNLISDAQKKYREHADSYQLNGVARFITNTQGKWPDTRGEEGGQMLNLFLLHSDLNSN